MSNNPRPPLFIISLCRGSRLSSRPRSWRSWEAFIRRFLANLASGELIVFHSESADVCAEFPPPGNWCFVHLSRAVYDCFASPSRSRPSPTVSSTVLISFALDHLIAAQLRATRTVFSCLPTRLEHPNTWTRPVPDQPEFCLYLLLHSDFLFPVRIVRFYLLKTESETLRFCSPYANAVTLTVTPLI